MNPIEFLQKIGEIKLTNGKVAVQQNLFEL